ncbi:neuropeptide S receptor-like isoform X2 [Babylonia areolata]|uniref:neuropeptide S receptor-like isoform X2 n=1 Tax=Babylonia areolata TaxID=304850 RepID=UPI003FD5F2DE
MDGDNNNQVMFDDADFIDEDVSAVLCARNDTECEWVVVYGNETLSMYKFYMVPQLVFVSLLFVFIVVGNCCVLAAIQLSDSGRKTRMNFFIMHLAIADLLVGLICVLTDLLSKITVEWYAGNFMCKLLQYMQATVTYVSTYVLVSLSLDRYDAVARPMNFSRSPYQARMLITLSWLSALLFAAPSLFLFSVERHEDKQQCWIDFPEFWHWKLFMALVAVVTFFLPAVIISTCYVAIILIIWTKGQNSRDATVERTVLNGTNGAGADRQWSSGVEGQRHDTGRSIIPQAKIRTIKMTLIIVIVFILCWSPFFMYNLLELFGVIPQNDPLSTLIQSAAPLNSAANPIIYGIFSTRICRNLSCVRVAGGCRWWPRFKMPCADGARARPGKSAVLAPYPGAVPLRLVTRPCTRATRSTATSALGPKSALLPHQVNTEVRLPNEVVPEAAGRPPSPTADPQGCPSCADS